MAPKKVTGTSPLLHKRYKKEVPSTSPLLHKRYKKEVPGMSPLLVYYTCKLNVHKLESCPDAVCGKKRCMVVN